MKILLVVAPHNFRDEEYFIPRDIFLKNGFEVFTASIKKETADGIYGGEARVDFLIEDIKVDDYRAIVFVGGEGAMKYLDSEEVYLFIRKIPASIILSAICIAPLILLNAGVLKNRKVTVWSSPLERTPIKMIEEEAFYLEEEVVCDENIITAKGPEAAEKFTYKIIESCISSNTFWTL